jgi:hypothetical protein
MTDLKIRVFKGGKSQPDTTVTVPGNVIKIAANLIPKGLLEILQQKGIDIEELIKLSENPEAQGTLIEIEEHKKNEKVVVALE